MIEIEAGINKVYVVDNVRVEWSCGEQYKNRSMLFSMLEVSGLDDNSTRAQFWINPYRANIYEVNKMIAPYGVKIVENKNRPRKIKCTEETVEIKSEDGEVINITERKADFVANNKEVNMSDKIMDKYNKFHHKIEEEYEALNKCFEEEGILADIRKTREQIDNYNMMDKRKKLIEDALWDYEIKQTVRCEDAVEELEEATLECYNSKLDYIKSKKSTPEKEIEILESWIKTHTKAMEYAKNRRERCQKLGE